MQQSYCIQCKKTKSIDAFPKNYVSGLPSDTCTLCQDEQTHILNGGKKQQIPASVRASYYEKNLGICTKCGEIKPLTKFHSSKRTKLGYHYWCKLCKAKSFNTPKCKEIQAERASR